ncbi:rab GTPase-binding effector protein 1 [Elysia marginata]|uniref:Rab GTPase-binding effector protein 1 n=1 Tax=Elysia marginata TaxID=1093978 RepID=A0AAV4ESI8_9GAST|nr:rab GTPase-binding effector protein 1 [Elysia marginata]
MKEGQTERKHAQKALATEQQRNQNLLKYQAELEDALKKKAEEASTKISNLTTKLQECEKYVKDFREQMSTVHLQLQDHCKSLADDWGEVQKKKDKVVDKYSKTTQQLQNEDSNLPNNLEEMQLRLLKYCEEIISAKVAKEHAEDTVRAQVAFLKAQVTGDQKEPVSLEEAPT